VCEDVADAGHPVVALGLGQVADDVVGSPCVVSFVAAGPGVGEAAQERVESRRGAGEKSDGLGHASILCGSQVLRLAKEGVILMAKVPFLLLGERLKADALGYLEAKTAATAKAKCGGLSTATDDETVRRFGRDDALF
jgi:hypothetical protein